MQTFDRASKVTSICTCVQKYCQLLLNGVEWGYRLIGPLVIGDLRFWGSAIASFSHMKQPKAEPGWCGVRGVLSMERRGASLSNGIPTAKIDPVLHSFLFAFINMF